MKGGYYKKMNKNNICASSEKCTSVACAKIAHEIKNPLTLITSTLQLIEMQIPEVKKNKYWYSLYDEIDFISSLLNDFNTLNHLSTFDSILMDLGELVIDISQRFEPLLLKRNITLKLDIPDEIVHIYGDELRLKEVLTNLLKNSIEAFDSDKGIIAISLYKSDDTAKLVIKDNGCGLTPEQLSEVFDPFITFKENGTGLGLSIVKTILEHHNGTIDLKSNENIGTEFTISLPLVKMS